MAPKQKTFELIPTTVGLQGLNRPNGQSAPMSKPPMTTKQAKKAYRKANKGPKLSKAEQRRIELMEQDRIRKEFEKERNQARARTARERKKAKEDKAREDRKRNGLPLVDVRPSQDTISRFVRPPARKPPNPRLEATKEEETESSTEAESGIDADKPEEQQAECRLDDGYSENEAEDKENVNPVPDLEGREAKRRRISRVRSDSVDGSQSSTRRHPTGLVTKLAETIASESVSRATSVDIDDPINDALLQEQLVADVVLASSRKTSNSSPIEQKAQVDPEALPALSPAIAAETIVPPPQAQPLHSKPLEPLHHQQLARPPPQAIGPQIAKLHSSHQENLSQCRSTIRKPTSPYISAGRPRPPLQHPGFQIKPPPRFRAPMEPPNSHSVNPKFLPRHMRTPQERSSAYNTLCRQVGAAPSNDAPTSTQLFLLDHVDDFFPSPSQETQELLQKQETQKRGAMTTRHSKPVITPSTPSYIPGRSMRHPSPAAQTAPRTDCRAPTIEPIFDFPVSTQDFTFSSQDVRDIETPSKPRHEIQVGNAIGKQASMPEAKAASAVLTCYQPTKQSQHFSQQLSEHTSQEGHKGPETMAREQSILYEHLSPLPTTKELHEHSQTAYTKPAAEAQPPRLAQDLVKKQEMQPSLSPPKKRMFGSSGPGAEVLVAMERSYQQSRREGRAREEERRAQERWLRTKKMTIEASVVTKGPERQVTDDNRAVVVKNSPLGIPATAASQETDYGDLEIGSDDLAFLEDTTWLEDDLDDCL